MVERALHQKGLGTILTQERLALARSFSDVDALILSTSQYSAGFYSKLGFTISKVTPSGLSPGFGPGLDGIEMYLRIV